jgi:iron complex outermembrane recepter protein
MRQADATHIPQTSHRQAEATILSIALGLAAFFQYFMVYAIAEDQSPRPAVEDPSHKSTIKIQLNELVIVTATRSEMKLESSPGVTAVVTQDDITNRNVSTIDQAMNVIPGVFNRRGKGMMDTQAGINLRGFPSQQRTLIMLDGIAMNDSYTGAVQFGGMATENVERIEVVKGPFSSLYGGDAMGGVVNIITKIPERRGIILRGGFGSGLQNHQAMNDLMRGFFSYGETFKNKLGIRVSYGSSHTNGYANDLNAQTVQPPDGISGYRETTDTQGNRRFVLGDRGDNTWHDHDFGFRANYRISDASNLGFAFITTGYGYETDSPHTYLRDAAGNSVFSFTSGRTAIRESSFLSGAGNKRQDIYRLSFNTKLGRTLMHSSVSYLGINHNWYTTPGSTAATTSSGGPGTVAETPVHKIAGNLQFILPIHGRHILTAGADLTGNSAETKEYSLTNWRDENSRSSLNYHARGRSVTGGFYLQDELLIRNHLTAYLGIRGDFWRTYGGYAFQADTAGYPISYTKRNAFSLSPKVALVYRLSADTTIKTSIGRVFRPPTVYELYRTWSYASGTVYRGNPNLNPEAALSWDVALDQNLWKGASVSGAYFENRMSDLIYRRTDPANSKINEYINAGKAKGRGVELGFDQRVTPALKLFANGTFNSAKITKNSAKASTEGKFLTYLPRWVGNGGAEFERGRITATMVGRYVSKLYTQDENKDIFNNVPGSYDPYFTADTKVIYRIHPLLAVSFSVDNVFNRNYFSSYIAPGRSAFAELLVTWKE